MCTICYRASKTFNILASLILVIAVLTIGSQGELSFHLQKRIQSARNNSCIECKRILDLSIAEKRRLDILLKRIKDKLGIEPIIQAGKESNIKPRESMFIQQKFTETYPETSEIVSFPDKQENTTKKNVLLFTLDLRNNLGPLEAIKAHLWILVKQRKRGRSKGKRIVLRVSQLNDTGNSQTYLTSIRTRVRKTRWQKISLPVTLIQSMIDNNQHELILKISCKKCGKIVRPVLNKRHRNRKKRHKRMKEKRSGMKRRKNRKTDSVQPFLVISTRYKIRLRRNR